MGGNRIEQSHSLACAEAACTFEALEARLVLSLAYYDSVTIGEFAGFPGGEAGTLAGASDNGEYLWSSGAEQGAADDSPAFLVVDTEYRAWAEFPELAGSLVVDINSRGVVLGFDQTEGRAFLLDLDAGEQRRYLDALVIDAPAGFDLGAVSAIELGDDGVIILADNTEDSGRGGSVWGLLDGVVHELWYSASRVREVFVEPGNVVYAQRTLLDDPHGPGSEYDVVRWTLSEGLGVLDGLVNIYGVNAVGGMVGLSIDGKGIVSPEGEFTAVDFNFGYPLDIDDNGVVLTWIDESSHNVVIIEAGVYDGVALTLLQDRGGGYGRPVTITDSGLIVLSDGVSRRMEADELVRSLGDRVSVVVDREGRLIVSYVNERGGIGSIIERAGEVDFGEIAGMYGFGGDAPVYSFVGPRAGQVYLLHGQLRVNRFNAVQDRFEWIHNFIMPRTTVGAAALASPQGNGVIATYRDDGHLWLYYERLFTWPNGTQHWRWEGNDLTQNHLDRRGLETPRFVGRLDGFTTTWGAMNIVGFDASGDVHAVWWSPGLGSPLWTTSNLSELAGAPELVGNLAATATPWGGMQVTGTDARGHLISLWWSPAVGAWRATDLTQQLDGPALRHGSLDIAVGRYGSINIVATAADDQVVSYWWSPGQGWEAKRIIESGDGPTIPGPVSYFAAASGEQHIAGVDTDGHVIDLYWKPDGLGWRWQDLTQLALG